MAQTVQFISDYTLVEEAQRQFTASASDSVYLEEPETEDKMGLILSLCGSLHNLCVTLEKLDHAIKKKNMELEAKQKERSSASCGGDISA